MRRLLVFIGAVLSVLPMAGAVQPLVAIHDSELTRALESIPASGSTPTGAGTTGNEWWPTQWHYFVLPEAVKEALHSDGTAFQVVSDANISAGGLLNSNGLPRYPIVISLAAEAINDSEITQFTNYVAAGGFLMVGSSAFTRNTNGTTRGDFAIANEMGIHMSTASLQNWVNNFNFSKATDHRITAHIPGGPLTWQMPSSADEVSWPYQGVFAPERIWQVQATDATILAQGDASPYLLVKPYGKGYFIYHAGMQPLIGHGGYAPGMYAYGIFRKAIEWAFQSSRVPVAKLSPWPYAYNAAFMVRHDLENFGDEITNIAPSAQFEFANGAKGDYYFCTGTLRDELTNSPSAIAGIRQAVSSYNATVGPHNGGLVNPQNGSLPLSSYDYWHWGPDQAFNVPSNSLPLPGFTNGMAYAFTSISNSFLDIEGWLSGLTNGTRSWAAPYFNATREASYQIEQALNIKVTGEDKLTPFPHWTLSKQTANKYYPLLQIPVSDWFVLTQVAQSIEAGHAPGTVHETIDFYYNLGALINIYSHSLSTGGTIVQDYITYGLNTNLHPRIWSANALDILGWWQQRSNAHILASFATNGNQSVTTLTVSGATDPQTAVEILVPGKSVSALQVQTNHIVASGNAFRIVGDTIRVAVGTSVTNVQINYILNPTAVSDTYTVTSGQTLSMNAASGVLTNDTPGAGTNLTAILFSGPSHGILILTNNGGFTYTPTNNFTGVDTFVYRANDGITNSDPATVTIDVPPSGSLFYDNFTRNSNADPLAPWQVPMGKWDITNDVMLGTASGEDDYSDSFVGGMDWDDYTVQAQVQIPAGVGAWDAGISGRVNPLTGERYLVNIYPEGSPQGSSILRVIKFHGWRIWNYTPMIQVNLPGVGGSPHTLKLHFKGARIRVFYDGSQVADVTDNNFDGDPPFLNGGISIHMFMSSTFTATFDDVLVSPLPVTPTALDDFYTTIQGRPLTVPAPGVMANDTVGLGTNLTAILIAGPAHGTLSLSNNGGFLYTPTNNYFGDDEFNYKVNDGVTNSESATATITVLSNRPPVANNDNFTVVQGRTLTVPAVGVLTNDVVGWGTNLTTVLVSGPIHGVLTLSNNGGFTYVSTNTVFAGADGFTYRANDGVTNSSVATVSISVTTNFTPVAVNDSYSVVSNRSLVVSVPGVLANDTDANGDGLIAVLVNGPTNGSLSLNTNGGFTYTPTPNYLGPDSFTYRANDGLAVSPVALVTISVVTNSATTNHSPVAVDDSYTLFQDDVLTVNAPGVLANDTDADSDPLTAVLVSGPVHGVLSLTNDGSFTYTPTNSYTGTDSFSYFASDGQSNSAPATVSITISTNQSFGTLFFDDFTRSAGNTNPLLPWVVQAGFWSVTNGLLQGLSPNQSDFGYAYVPTNWGDYSAQIRVALASDAYAEGLIGRLNPATGNGYAAILFPQSSSIQLIKLQGWNGGYFSPMATFSLPSGVGTNWHTLKLAFKGNHIGVFYDGAQVAYTTDNNYDGVPAFLSGGIGVQMFMTAVFTSLYDDAMVRPLVVDDSYTTNQNATLIVAAPGVLGNDSAVFGTNLFATLVSGPTNGILTLNTNGSFSYTPTNNFSGVDTFTYQANDAQTNLGIATVTLNITGGAPTITVTPDDKSRGYGQSNPVLTGNLTGVQGGDNITATYTTIATTNSPVGTYAITPVLHDPDNKLGNYIVVTNTGTLTVTPASLSVTANNLIRLYGATNPVLTASYSGFVNGETASVLGGSPALSTSAATNSPVGAYPITVAQGTLSSSNYAFAFSNGVLTVNPVLLTVTAQNQVRLYGTTNSLFIASYIGFVNGDNENMLAGTPALNTTATTNSPVGTYAIIAAQGTLVSTNYAFAFSNGVLTVNQVLLTVTANNQFRLYGATNPLLTASYNGFVNGETTSVLGGSPALNTSATTNSPVGAYPITVAQGTLTSTNYAFAFTNGVLTVNQALLTVAANNQVRLYGATNPVLTASYSGFVNGETTSVLGGSPALNTSATTNSPVGAYPITVAQGTLTSTNYAFAFTNGVLTVNKALLAVAANYQFRPYGVTNPVLTASYSGFVNGETTSVLGGSPALSTSATTNSPVGPYPIIVAQGTLTSTNYAFAFTNGVLMVNKALLSVSADNKSRPYGASNPVFTASYSGFVNGETLGTSGVTGGPDLNTSATSASPAGSYPITLALGTLNSGNYLFDLSDGTLSIFNVQPVILSIIRSGTNTVALTWSAVSNLTYRVQYQTNLSAAVWSNTVPDVTATNATASATDNPGNDPRRFYRILIVPQ